MHRLTYRFGYKRFIYNLCIQKLIYNIMLGIESTHKPLKGQFAKELREALHRARTGNLNQEEKEGVIRSEKASKRYNAIWK